MTDVSRVNGIKAIGDMTYNEMLKEIEAKKDNHDTTIFDWDDNGSLDFTEAYAALNTIRKAERKQAEAAKAVTSQVEVDGPITEENESEYYAKNITRLAELLGKSEDEVKKLTYEELQNTKYQILIGAADHIPADKREAVEKTMTNLAVLYYLNPSFAPADEEVAEEASEVEEIEYEEADEESYTADEETQQEYVSLVEDLAQYYPRTETDTLNVEYIQTLGLDELRAEYTQQQAISEDPEVNPNHLKSLERMIEFMEINGGAPELDAPLTNIEDITKLPGYSAEVQDETPKAAAEEKPFNGLAALAEEQQAKKEEEEKGILSQAGDALSATGKFVGKVTGWTSAMQSLDRKNERVEIITKETSGWGYIPAVVGNVAAQPTDIVSHLTEIPNEYGLDQLEELVDKTNVDEVKDNGDKAAKAGSDLLHAVASPFKAIGGILNIGGSVADGTSSVLKAEDTTNGIIDRSTEHTMGLLADSLADDSAENVNDKKTAIKLPIRLGISEDDLKKMTPEQIREIITKEYSEDAIGAFEVETTAKDGTVTKTIVELDPNAPDEAVVIRAAVNAAADEIAQKNANARVYQREDAAEKLNRGQQQVREAVSELANAPAAAVDLVDAGLSAGIEAVSNKGVADFFTAPLKIVTGTAQMITTSFDGKEGSTTSAGKKFLQGITFGFYSPDEPEETKTEEPKTEEAKAEATKEDTKAEEKPAAPVVSEAPKKRLSRKDRVAAKKAEYKAQYESAKAEVVAQTIEEDAKVLAEELTRAEAAKKEANPDAVVLTAEEIQETALADATKINSAIEKAAQDLQDSNAIERIDAMRIGRRAENAGVAGTEFWNEMDGTYSNTDNTAGDRGFWANSASVGKGFLYAIPRAFTTKSVTTANQLMAGGFCHGIAAAEFTSNAIRDYKEAYRTYDEYNTAGKKSSYEKGGQGFFHTLGAVTAWLYTFLDQAHCSTYQSHGKNKHCWDIDRLFHKCGHKHHKPTQGPYKPDPTPTPTPTPDEIFIEDPSQFSLGLL